MLVTMSVELVGTQIIHHIHYMGRRVGRARLIANRMLQFAQNISVNRGISYGLSQMSAFARLGLLVNVKDNDRRQLYVKRGDVLLAFAEIDFDFVDYSIHSNREVHARINSNK